MLICIIRWSLPNPASAEIVPNGNLIVITGSATCGALPPRRDAQASGFSDEINNARLDVSSNTISCNMSAMGGSDIPTLSNHKTICENMTLGAYEKTDAYKLVQRFMRKRC